MSPSITRDAEDIANWLFDRAKSRYGPDLTSPNSEVRRASGSAARALMAAASLILQGEGPESSLR